MATLHPTIERVTARIIERSKGSRTRYLDLIESSFAPLPVARAPYFDREIVGFDQLNRLAEAVYGSSDPTASRYTGQTHRIERTEAGWELRVPLPFAERSAIDLHRAGDELTVAVGNFRRHFVLPRALAALPSDRARFAGDTLIVQFATPTTTAAGR